MVMNFSVGGWREKSLKKGFAAGGDTDSVCVVIVLDITSSARCMPGKSSSWLQGERCLVIYVVGDRAFPSHPESSPHESAVKSAEDLDDISLSSPCQGRQLQSACTSHARSRGYVSSISRLDDSENQKLVLDEAEET